MEIAYIGRYRTVVELSRAYERLGHTSKTNAWSATLLIDPNLDLTWACPVVGDPDPDGQATQSWHIIARAGELDWPPLRPEEEIWPALLARHPVPTGDRAEREARSLGVDIETWHRNQLRLRYLSDAHSGKTKLSPIDMNFDRLVRDWDVTARELAEFIDAHKPPKLTTEQRVMAQGAQLARLEAAVETTKISLARLMRNAARDQEGSPRPRRGFKADMARWSGRSRPTVDAWLADAQCCEPSVPDEDGTTHPGHAHSDDNAADL